MRFGSRPVAGRTDSISVWIISKHLWNSSPFPPVDEHNDEKAVPPKGKAFIPQICVSPAL